ncbi:MAG TPA: hypothetical protein VNH82_01190 [Candidatus Dormibacteraeota bacterium]|nr:hypothetical protein [Candidatus Dormibacteraeota bacterium]
MEELLSRCRYHRVPEFRGYCNGHLRQQISLVGIGAVEVRIPRLREVPREVAPDGFESALVHRCERGSQTQVPLLAHLCLEGLSSGDFERVGRWWTRPRRCH